VASQCNAANAEQNACGMQSGFATQNVMELYVSQGVSRFTRRSRFARRQPFCKAGILAKVFSLTSKPNYQKQ
jgi:hypothetical protein